MKLFLKKDLLFDDQVYGKESVINMTDEGRADYLLKTGHAIRADEKAEITHRSPPPKQARSQQANELAEAITEAIRAGRTFEVDPPVVQKARAE